VRSALAGRPATAFGTLGDTALAHVVAVPVEGATPGRVVGVLMAARPLDARAARGGTDAEGGREVAFYLLPRGGAPRLAAATLAPAPGLAAVLAALPGAGPDDADDGDAAAPAEPREVTVGGRRYLARAHPLRAASGRAVGGYAVLRARDVEYAAFVALRRATLAAGAVGLLAALLVSFVIARQITRPLAALAEAARRAAEGDYAAPFAARPGRDEVGVLAGAFRTLLDDLRAKQVLVEFARLTRAPRPSGRSRPSTDRRRGTPPRPLAPPAPPEPTVRLVRDGAAAAACPGGGRCWGGTGRSGAGRA
jgi:serine/threonine-protein kinase